MNNENVTNFSKLSFREIVTNHCQRFEFEGYSVRFSSIKTYEMPDKEMLNDWIKKLYDNLISGSFDFFVFCIFDMKNDMTYEYQFTCDFVKEIVHFSIVSIEDDVIPRMKKRCMFYGGFEGYIIREIIEELTSKSRTIATMESCTGGQLASDITNVSGASEVLKESYITYCNEAKIKFGVSKKVIDKYGVYSYETAKAMAEAALIEANADIGIGVTGQLGRADPKNPGVSDNQVWYAIKGSKTGINVARKILVRSAYDRFEKKKIITREIMWTLYDSLKI